jgi:hypothetical protein
MTDVGARNDWQQLASGMRSAANGCSPCGGPDQAAGIARIEATLA